MVDFSKILFRSDSVSRSMFVLLSSDKTIKSSVPLSFFLFFGGCHSACSRRCPHCSERITLKAVKRVKFVQPTVCLSTEKIPINRLQLSDTGQLFANSLRVVPRIVGVPFRALALFDINQVERAHVYLLRPFAAPIVEASSSFFQIAHRLINKFDNQQQQIIVLLWVVKALNQTQVKIFRGSFSFMISAVFFAVQVQETMDEIIVADQVNPAKYRGGTKLFHLFRHVVAVHPKFVTKPLMTKSKRYDLPRSPLHSPRQIKLLTKCSPLDCFQMRLFDTNYFLRTFTVVVNKVLDLIGIQERKTRQLSLLLFFFFNLHSDNKITHSLWTCQR
mmetsp:Transcript_5679/g.11816  ORF Transcript_5679/g.11816 Transcript_5679/m.11816 type:complete len:331 (+) Transcript_5679:1146-2138(+)